PVAGGFSGVVRFDQWIRPIEPMLDILEYQASDAKERFAELLDQVEQGRTVRITRHGKAIARLVPEPDARKAEVAEAIARLKALRQEFGKAPLDEVLESVREHHAGLQSFRSMRRMEARRRKASALRLRHSQSLASLRQRPSQAKVRSTIQRLGRVTKPFA